MGGAAGGAVNRRKGNSANLDVPQARHLARVKLGFQRLNLRVFGRRCFLQRMGDLGLGQSNRVALFPLGQFEALVQSLLKLAIAHLLEDVGIA